MDSLSLTKEARIYNGEKTISLTSGAGKTGQPLVKNETRTFSKTIHTNKLKIFCTTKETISKIKRQRSEWEKIIANEATDK